MLNIYTFLLLFVPLTMVKCQYDENNFCMGQLKVFYDQNVQKCLCQCCGAKECVPCTFNDFQLERLSMKYVCVDYSCDSLCLPQTTVACKGNYTFSLISGNLYSQCYHLTTKCRNSLNRESVLNYCAQIEITQKESNALVKSQYDEFNLCMGQLKVSFNKLTKECICECCGGIECSPCTYSDYMTPRLSMKFSCSAEACDSYCDPDKTITCKSEYSFKQVSENYYQQCYDLTTKCGSSSNNVTNLTYCNFVLVTKVNPTKTSSTSTTTTRVQTTTLSTTKITNSVTVSTPMVITTLASTTKPVTSSLSQNTVVTNENSISYLTSSTTSKPLSSEILNTEKSVNSSANRLFLFSFTFHFILFY